MGLQLAHRSFARSWPRSIGLCLFHLPLLLVACPISREWTLLRPGSPASAGAGGSRTPADGGHFQAVDALGMLT